MGCSIIFLPTAPFIFTNAIDKHRLQWILVYIAEKCDEIREVVDRLALEPLLKQMPHSVVFVIIVIYEEMYMIAHQTIGIYMTSGLKGLTLCVNIRLRLPTKDVEETYVVLIVLKHLMFVHATKYGVINVSG